MISSSCFRDRRACIRHHTRRLTERDQVSLASLLERSDSGRLEPEVGLEVLSDLTDETLEGKLPDQELGGFLRARSDRRVE